MMKRLFFLALTAAAALAAQPYTRGIGVYPGDPREDSSPVMTVDNSTYRNLALRRAAYHSSSYDYNLTANQIAGATPPRLPGINNWDMTVFKNFPLKRETRNLQFRWEFYNIVNHTQFNAVNTTVTFDATGKPVNTQFGQATGARTPRLMQVSLRLRF